MPLLWLRWNIGHHWSDLCMCPGHPLLPPKLFFWLFKIIMKKIIKGVFFFHDWYSQLKTIDHTRQRQAIKRVNQNVQTVPQIKQNHGTVQRVLIITCMPPSLAQWRSGDSTLMPGLVIYPGAEVVVIKHQSRTPPTPFPNHQFQPLHHTTFVEQKVAIHLGDCQDIFFFNALCLSKTACCVSACVSCSPFHLIPSHLSLFLLYSFLKVACWENIAVLSNEETQPVTGSNNCTVIEERSEGRGQTGRASGHYWQCTLACCLTLYIYRSHRDIKELWLNRWAVQLNSSDAAVTICLDVMDLWTEQTRTVDRDWMMDLFIPISRYPHRNGMKLSF